MTFSYSNDPALNRMDAARFLVGDTDAATAMLDDAEVEYALDQHGSPERAAAALADALAAQVAKKMDKAVGPAKIAYSQQFDHYIALATRLRATASASTVIGPRVGYDVTQPPPRKFTMDTGKVRTP